MRLFHTASLLPSIILAPRSQAEQAENLTIFTPDFVAQCEPVLFQWTGGISPYTLWLNREVGDPIIVGQSSDDSYSMSWLANVTTGQKITPKVVDEKGALAYAAPVQVSVGLTDHCMKSEDKGTSSETQPTSSPVNVPAVAGSIVAGVLVLLAAAFSLFWFIRKRCDSKFREFDKEEFYVDTDEEVEPFVPVHTNPTRSPGLLVGPLQSYPPSASGSRPATSPSGSFFSGKVPPRAVEEEVIAVHEEDGGPVEAPAMRLTSNVVSLPPMYNPAWQERSASSPP